MIYVRAAQATPLIRHSRVSPLTWLRSISHRFPLARLCLNCPPAVFDLYPRGFTGHVAHPSRSIRRGQRQRPEACCSRLHRGRNRPGVGATPAWPFVGSRPRSQLPGLLDQRSASLTQAYRPKEDRPPIASSLAVPRSCWYARNAYRVRGPIIPSTGPR